MNNVLDPNLSHIYKISIITVCLNADKTIEETINSVINQSYNNVEFIIIDGGSTDSTLEIINKYEDKIDYWVSEPDYGLYHAMNKGIEKATGDIVGLINADDHYFDGVFDYVIKAFEGKSLDKYIFYGDMVHNGKVVTGWREKQLRIGAFSNHPTMFCPKNIYNKIGVYKLWYKILADYDFMYRAYHLFKIKPIYCAEPISYFRVGGLASNNIFRSLTEEMLIKIENEEKIYLSFSIYLLKLIKFSLSKIISKVANYF
jgi:glycosyltransferase involved in cell wall biosynthesis